VALQEGNVDLGCIAGVQKSRYLVEETARYLDAFFTVKVISCFKHYKTGPLQAR
jgi:hypothetical protein